MSPRSMCVKCYHNHPKGCPNYNKKIGWPPNIEMFDQVFDMNEDIYAIITLFDMKSHVERMKELHPTWSEYMLRNSRYWQGTNRKDQKLTIKSFNEKYPDLSDRFFEALEVAKKELEEQETISM